MISASTTSEEFDNYEEMGGEEKGASGTSRFRLIVSDSFLSFAWVFSRSIIKYLVFVIAGVDVISHLIHGFVAALYHYCFSQFGEATNGGSYNPLIVLSSAISASFLEFLFVVFGRIPAQVIGSSMAVWLINAALPSVSDGPCLNVDVNCGALIEGVLALLVILLSIESKKLPRSSNKIWIYCAARAMLHVLGSKTTGGIMNPATAFGWAYAKGKHLTKEHLSVYWLAPMEATLLVVWISSLFSKLPKHWQLRDL